MADEAQLLVNLINTNRLHYRWAQKDYLDAMESYDEACERLTREFKVYGKLNHKRDRVREVLSSEIAVAKRQMDQAHKLMASFNKELYEGKLHDLVDQEIVERTQLQSQMKHEVAQEQFKKAQLRYKRAFDAMHDETIRYGSNPLREFTRNELMTELEAAEANLEFCKSMMYKWAL